MRAVRAAFAPLLAALALAAPACERAAADRPASPRTTISVIGTNDLHGAVAPVDGIGGLALLDGFIRNVRAVRERDQGAVLVLDAGDLFQGTLESNLNEGAVVVAAYNAIGYTAAAVGNHEFDFGPVGEAVMARDAGDDPRGALKARAAEARFPFLAANVVDRVTGRPVEWPNIRPSVTIDAAGVKVGIVGVTTAATLASTSPENTRGLTIAPPADALAAEATRLKESGAEVIVAVAHAGGGCTRFEDPEDLSSCAADEEIFQIARALPRGLVHVIVAGHRHLAVAHRVLDTAIVASYWRGRAFGRVDIQIDRASGRVTSHIFPPREVCAREDPDTRACVPASSGGSPVLYEGAPVTGSAAIEAILEPAVARARMQKDAPLGGFAEDALPRVSGEESALGNLMADWMRELVPRADAAITNAGGVRAPLPAGQLTYGRLYEVLPFDNREVVISVTGAELRRVIEHNLRQTHDLILLSGVVARAACEGGSLRVALRRESGRPIADDEVLRVVTSDYLATGGGGMFDPIMPLRIEGDGEEGPVIRDSLVERLQGSQARWRASDLFTSERQRLVFRGPRPVTCQ